jgi:lysophospholipase L1-like esterase
VLLLHGVNDLNGSEAGRVQAVVDGLEDHVKQARSRGMTVFVASLPPLGPPKGGCPECVIPLNERLQSMALARGAVFVDVYAAWGNRPGLMGADGIHPTEAGSEVIAQTFFEAIRKALEPPLP